MRDVLMRAGIKDTATEILFEGADSGEEEEEGSAIVLVAGMYAGHDEACCPTEMIRPPDNLSEGPDAPCLWWRRGRVELPVQRALKGIYSRRSH